MTVRNRLTVAAAVAVAAAVIATSIAIDLAVRQEVLAQVDDSLHQRVEAVGAVQITTAGQSAPRLPPPPIGAPDSYVQVVSATGSVMPPTGGRVTLPVSRRDVLVAAGEASAYFQDVHVNGVHMRVYTAPVGGGTALQVARSMAEPDRLLAFLELLLAAGCLAGVALAAALGWLVARTALRPLQRLSGAVDSVTLTGDLSQRIPATADDELGRLAFNFNRMLAALDDSLRSQRQLVADASHELRTPLASLRTNLELFARRQRRRAGADVQLLEDLGRQLEQLTRLVQDVIDLARGDRPPELVEDVRLDRVVEVCVQRAARHWPGVRFTSALEPCVVPGDPQRLERAVANLLDNAGKWSPAGGAVEVAMDQRELTVRDHGAGVAPDDLPHVFNRFWRAAGSRGLPGSGLGLAIVRQVADQHGADVSMELPEGGGTLVRLTFHGTTSPP